jgi:hypothetical protein
MLPTIGYEMVKPLPVMLGNAACKSIRASQVMMDRGKAHFITLEFRVADSNDLKKKFTLNKHFGD